MAIKLEFIDFIVPIKTIKEKYPGGWDQCFKDHYYSVGRCIWYDDHLFRTGAMGGEGIKSLVEEWASLGFKTHEVEDGNYTKWLDVCVVEFLFGGATLPCDWIEIDTREPFAWLKGTDQGKIISRHDFDATDEIPDWVFE